MLISAYYAEINRSNLRIRQTSPATFTASR